MNLYFFKGTDVNGDALDWFILAPDLMTAMMQWLGDDAAGPMVDASTRAPDVFLLPTNISQSGYARALNWYVDVAKVEEREVKDAFTRLCIQ